MGGLTAEGKMTTSIYRYSTPHCYGSVKAWPISQVAFYASWEVFFAGALLEEVSAHETHSAEVMVAGHGTIYHADTDSPIVFWRSHYKHSCLQVSTLF